MQIPDLNRVIETFVRYEPFPEAHLPEIGKRYDLALKHAPLLGVSVTIEGFHVWQSACWTLRVAVVPLLHRLVESGLVNWHWTLVHNSVTGVPTPPDDLEPWFHVRLGMAPGVSEETLVASLPTFCRMTRRSVPSATLDNIDLSLFPNPETAWYWMARLNEPVLELLVNLPPHRATPWETLTQALHYTGNLLQAKAGGLRLP